MTRIDRYLLTTYLRTLLICFCSLSGIFVVFHAFNNMEEIAAYARRQGSFVDALVSYYGPFLLAIFDATNAILAVFALVFSVGALKRNGELTALLAAGLSHGRILRPMLIAAFVVIVIAVINRELCMPNWKDQLGAKAQDLDGQLVRTLKPSYDRMTGIQFHGRGVIVIKKEIVAPALMIRSEMPGMGTQIVGELAVWQDASDQHPDGYLLNDVTQPQEIDTIPSSGFGGKQFVLTRADNPWLEPGQCFVVSNIEFEHLVSGAQTDRLSSTLQLVRNIQNPSVYSGPDAEVLLHTRIVRPWLDISLVLLGLPLVVTRGDKNLFVVAGWGLGLIAMFFFVKTVFSGLGSSETLISPAMGAWGPIIVFAPMGYSRWKAAART
ncbi:putative permease YjgP/YjgQ family protein [Rosistilla carotiformis]|uniref:Putative permease YjgP/YjgQ family protein n=1 Tax=Rosistilla carotiformis TaxID=2528017 RepID=A0A518JTA4_9BACT|nr:LptF/LptG family permease [Rosistilla carotiformis]QDV68781.1 putative permease YjgP/YjgQ family protein [Rosistilla carotiformis]